MITMRVRVSDKPLVAYTEEVNAKLPGVVKKHALAIQGKAADAAPVDTGALKNSLTAKKDEEGNELRWEIMDGVEYGVYQELGQPPRAKKPHFLGNACEVQADKFFDDVKEALKG